MLSRLIRLIYGSKNDRFIKKNQYLVNAIQEQEHELKAQSDKQLQDRARSLRKRADNEPLDALLVDTFALVREASRRTLGLRHHDVQMIGGIALHQGNIAEMATGEGQTLVATLAATLNAWSGKGVHIVTVNGYLAQRDAQWMGKI